MFGRNQNKQGVVDSLIGSNSRVNGDLKFEGGCHIDGTVKGNVSADAESSSTLSISEDGTIEGGVSVPHIVLNGIVRGDVFASQRIELGPTCSDPRSFLGQVVGRRLHRSRSERRRSELVG